MRKRGKKKPKLFSIILIIITVGFGIAKHFDNNNYKSTTKEIDKTEVELVNNDNEEIKKNNDIKDDSYEIPVLTSKSGGQIIKHKGYTLSYSADYKTPQWVGWELTRKETFGNVSRTNKFLPDPYIIGAKAYTKDYSNSGYDRGHMAPAGDMKWDKKAMEESFYLSNICPQNSNLNRGDWNDLEELSRNLAKKHGKIYITCGPIYDNKYPKRIGNNRVAVPDAFYKVIFINDKKSPKAYGFIFSNKAGSKPLKNYLVTVDSIESRTKIDFLPTLDKKIQDKIEAEQHTAIPN